MDITNPGIGKFKVKQLIFNLNGAIALDAKIIQGVAERLPARRSSSMYPFFGFTPLQKGLSHLWQSEKNNKFGHYLSPCPHFLTGYT